MASAFAPATVANVACGFDIFGFAIEGLGDVVTAELREEPGVTIGEVRGGVELPVDPERNTAGMAAGCLLEALGERRGVELIIEKRMPIASGLGSSAASAVAAVVAVDALLGGVADPDVLLRCAVAGEAVASGVPHADNVAPSLLGGFTLVRGGIADLRVDRIPVPEELWCAIVHPHLAVETRGSRAAIGDRIEIGQAVRQWGNVAALTAGLVQGDWDLLASGLEDVVAEPARSGRVPGFASMMETARREGALGGSLSGSGPSVFAFCRGKESAERVAAAMQGEYEATGTGGSDVHVSRVGAEGAASCDS